MKTRFWMILFLTLIWCGFSNNFSMPNILFGLLVSLIIHSCAAKKRLSFRVNMLQLVILSFYTLWELLQSSILVAWEVLTPLGKSKPELIEIKLQTNHAIAISILANLISLTPGTLVIDIDEKRKIFLIHIMFSKNKKNIITFIENQLMKKVMRFIEYDNR